MPVLENARRERFAQLMAEGNKPEVAHELAGYTPHYSNAVNLSKKPDVAARIGELQAAIAEKVVVDRAWVINQLVANVLRCTGDNDARNPNAANKALELLGKEIGMFKDQVDINHNYVARMPAPQESVETWEEQQRPLLPN